MVGIFYACFHQNAYLCRPNLNWFVLPMNKKQILFGWLALLLLFASCQPKSDLSKIDALRKQVNKEAKVLNDLNTNAFMQLEKDFIACDSSLQYLSEEQLDVVFPKLQLVDAYIQQFKETRPIMQAEMDSTLVRLDLLKKDAATHYLTDSLVAAYKLSSQVAYFKDRLGSCRKELDVIKERK